MDLLAGDHYRKVIREVIDKCSAAIVLWSGKSIESDFVMDEASHAKNHGKLCPVRIDDVPLPFGFGQAHTDDLTGWQGELTHPSFQSLVKSVEARVGRKAKLGTTNSNPESRARSAELEAFKAAQLAGNLSAFQAFLKEHPHGAFASFVRNQIVAMAAPASRPQVVEAEAHGSQPTQDRVVGSQTPSPRSPEPRGKPFPLARIIGVGSIVVVALGGYSLYDQSREEARRAQAEIKAQQEKREEERRSLEAAEARTKELEVKEREAREQADQERIARQKAEEQQIALESAERERAAREAEQQRTSAAKAAQQRLAREKAEREKEAQQKAAREAEAKTPGATLSPPYDLGQLDPQVRAAVARGRDAAGRADAAAARARSAAEKARLSGATYPKSGLGVYRSKSGGNEYAGNFEDGKRTGFGVYSFGQNANTDNGLLRYEGAWVADKPNGVGVEFWRRGDRQSGTYRDGRKSGPGVFTLVNGARYEGEFESGKPSGPGVEWDAQGRVRRAGIWTDGKLATPLGPQAR